MVKLSAKSPAAALGIAKAGINYMHNNFLFVDPKDPSKVETFASYMSQPAVGFETGEIEGTSRVEKPLAVKYKGSGKISVTCRNLCAYPCHDTHSMQILLAQHSRSNLKNGRNMGLWSPMRLPLSAPSQRAI